MYGYAFIFMFKVFKRNKSLKSNGQKNQKYIIDMINIER